MSNGTDTTTRGSIDAAKAAMELPKVRADLERAQESLQQETAAKKAAQEERDKAQKRADRLSRERDKAQRSVDKLSEATKTGLAQSKALKVSAIGGVVAAVALALIFLGLWGWGGQVFSFWTYCVSFVVVAGGIALLPLIGWGIEKGGPGLYEHRYAVAAGAGLVVGLIMALVFTKATGPMYFGIFVGTMLGFGVLFFSWFWAILRLSHDEVDVKKPIAATAPDNTGEVAASDSDDAQPGSSSPPPLPADKDKGKVDGTDGDDELDRMLDDDDEDEDTTKGDVRLSSDLVFDVVAAVLLVVIPISFLSSLIFFHPVQDVFTRPAGVIILGTGVGAAEMVLNIYLGIVATVVTGILLGILLWIVLEIVAHAWQGIKDFASLAKTDGWLFGAKFTVFVAGFFVAGLVARELWSPGKGGEENWVAVVMFILAFLAFELSFLNLLRAIKERRGVGFAFVIAIVITVPAVYVSMSTFYARGSESERVDHLRGILETRISAYTSATFDDVESFAQALPEQADALRGAKTALTEHVNTLQELENNADMQRLAAKVRAEGAPLGMVLSKQERQAGLLEQVRIPSEPSATNLLAHFVGVAPAPAGVPSRYWGAFFTSLGQAMLAEVVALIVMLMYWNSLRRRRKKGKKGADVNDEFDGEVVSTALRGGQDILVAFGPYASNVKAGAKAQILDAFGENVLDVGFAKKGFGNGTWILRLPQATSAIPLEGKVRFIS